MAIKPKEFDFKKSRWQDIYSLLKRKGFDVYAPAQKVGECTSNYLVVKSDGSYKHVNFSTDRDMYTILCYVPLNKYSELEPLLQSVKGVMKELYPMIQPYGQQLPSYYDDAVKGHYIAITYENYKKI